MGLYSMKHRNEATLAKLCWRLAHEEGKLWENMLTTKYLCPNRVTEEGRKLPYSRVWVACKKGGPIYVKGLRWIVRNGDSVNMWMDFWLPNERLRELIEGPLTRGEEELKIMIESLQASPLSSQQVCLILSRPLPSLIYLKLMIVSCGPIPKMDHSLFKQPISLQRD